MTLAITEGDRFRPTPDRLPGHYADAIASLQDRKTGKHLPVRVFRPNTVIMQKGLSGSTMYVILEGGVRVDFGGSLPIRISGKGGFFGEIASLFENTNRAATVTSEGPVSTRALEISTADVLGLLMLGGSFEYSYQIITNTAVSRALDNLTNNPQAAKVSGIPSIDQWKETESGLRVPPLRAIPHTRFVVPK